MGVVRYIAVLSALLTVVSISPASADDIADFYKGKRLTIVVGYDPGSGYDLYARLIGKHLVDHIPGKPSFLPQNMPGAGSRKAANWLYEIAPKDGTFIATVGNSVALDQALGEPSIQYDAAKFNWIGNPKVDIGVTITLATGPYPTIEDVKAKGGMICGGTGAASPSITYPQLMNEFIGTDIKVVSGYPNPSDVALAMQRGEVHCIAGETWTSLKTALADMYNDKKFAILLQWGAERNPAISAYAGRDVPSIFDYVKTPTDRKVMDLLLSSETIGRPIMAPPGVPSERVAALRRAFDETMEDPGFLADIKQARLDLDPLSGERLQDLIASFSGTSPEVRARAKDLMRPPQGYTERKQHP